jgi:hypothetical protein
LNDRSWPEEIEARHRQEFYERRLGAPLRDFHGAIASGDMAKACSIIDGDAQSADIGGALLLPAVEGSAALIDALASRRAPIHRWTNAEDASAHRRGGRQSIRT